MTLVQTGKKGVKGGWVLYGSLDTGKWFERWYSSRKKAEAYATKKGWTLV